MNYLYVRYSSKIDHLPWWVRGSVDELSDPWPFDPILENIRFLLSRRQRESRKHDSETWHRLKILEHAGESHKLCSHDLYWKKTLNLSQRRQSFKVHGEKRHQHILYKCWDPGPVHNTSRKKITIYITLNITTSMYWQFNGSTAIKTTNK